MTSKHAIDKTPPLVGDVAEKTFVSLDEDTLVAVAAKTLYETEASSIIVTRNEPVTNTRHPIGIVTERDMIYRVVAQNKGTFKVTVGKIMSTPIITIDEDASTDEALSVMKSRKINRLPVVNRGDVLIGVVSMENLVRRANVKTTTA